MLMRTIEMNNTEIKSNLHEFIDFIEDSNLLKAIYLLLASNTALKEKRDFWFELPDKVKLDIDEAISEADRGEFIPHEQAMKQIREKVR